MKTTLEIDGGVMRELKKKAAQEGRTMSELVEMALRTLLTREETPPKDLPPLPTFRGEFLVNIDDRGALYDAMGEEGP